MAQLEVRLLGRPAVLVDGAEVPPPKGAKPWALLAYLVADDRPRPRAELAELLFSGASDPLGALRWNLAALRRLLDRPDVVKGDPIGLDLSDARIDVRDVLSAHGPPTDPAPDGLLLAGLSFPDSPRFELWLAGERARLSRLQMSRQREAVLRGLASGDHETALDLATALVAVDPLDESSHALLIRAHAVAGDVGMARSQYERCREVLRRELSVEPGGAVVAAVHFASEVAERRQPVDVATVEARLAIAWQSFLAGSVDHAIDLGRDASTMADREHDLGLRVMARLFFAAMLSIAVRGADEGSAVATEALLLAQDADLAYEEAAAHGVLAGIDLMRADYAAAVAHCGLGDLRCPDPGTRALCVAFDAAVSADVGQGERAVELAAEAVELADASADPIRVVYAHAYAGHALLLQDQPEAARPHVERAIQAASAVLVLQPWPLAMLADIDVRAGRLDAAERSAEQARAMSSTTGIAYQQALALRASALLAAARGDRGRALDELVRALALARRTSGEGYTFHWPIAWVLESLARVSAPVDRASSQRWAQALLDHATAVGMHTFIRRGQELIAGE